ncbi:flagellar biosynthetic protein FliR [Spirilliplanes yamanashiensis]|uniref:Flagellar biosynthetic protein FliR n=1 Tax=Spirilliplanes yamanashiensis TaxID=42233 RepID=A0A8J3Y650_9ACTN|nr:flagellar biosynthetic protein FliR [Spirilliplanes yamanashiensis]MDP9814395.1 flagellar biosynthetic protein FliR [Spirilliplanes yamanashiensis]GIJ02048.1 flagellar biosynthetic protein FliR [Spirilliplanes yamanashiensis]
MIDIDAQIGNLVALMLAALRTSAWIIICPPFNSRLIPRQVKILLAIGLSLPMADKVQGTLPDIGTMALIATAALQVVIGASLGFVTLLFFAAIQAAGDMLDLFGGFSLAQAYDPLSQSQNSVFGRFYNLLAVTLLFGTQGHMLIIRGFLQTFDTLPLDRALSMATLNRFLTAGVGEFFVSALQIAGPLIAVLFLTDIAFGLLNRAAPALNAFGLGFPAKIFLTLSLAGTAIAVLPRALEGLVDQAVRAVVTLSGG